MEHPDMMRISSGKVACNKTRIFFIAILVVVVIVVVGVLAAMYGKQCNESPGSLESRKKPPVWTKPIEKSDEKPEEKPWLNLRLPNTTVPVHYDVYLFPDIYDGHSTFYGRVAVEIDVKRYTRFLLIHIKQMNITSTRVVKPFSELEIKIKKAFPYVANQYWVVEMATPVPPGRTVKLLLTFNGSLINGIYGFYRSTYRNSITRERRVLATSKFEPVDARKAFPCFDEPNMKASFTVTLKHKDDYIALSNMPVESNRTLKGGMMETIFQKSVPMSTYLVCFIVCDFNYKELTTNSGKPIRAYATPDKIDQVDYALHVGKHMFDQFEEFFAMSYPLPKIDMIAIPDFVSGAMEHWGLITYRETNLLYAGSEVSARNKQRVAEVVAHELAHQWFGNIVTMDWWDDLWLNEGFASFMEYKGVNYVEPQWDMLDQFVTNDLQPVFGHDANVNSHPIVVEVNHPDEITAVFDSISYNKGSSVIRMLEGVMGPDNFRDGIRNYLKNFKYRNAKTANLWEALEKIMPPNGIPPVGDVMDTWTRQMGFPVIDISYQSGRITARQTRYLTDEDAEFSAKESPYGYKWFVPLHYITSENKTQTTRWMRKDDVTFESPVDLTASNKWIKFNVNVTAYYRVNYPPNVWQTLSDVLLQDVEALWPSDRAELVNDAFELARSGRLAYTIPLTLVRYLENELHYIPWESANSGMQYIGAMMKSKPTYDKYKKYMIQLSSPTMQALTWNSSRGENLEKYLRTLVIHIACGHGDEVCLATAGNMLQDWINGSIIHPDMRTMVYQYGMRSVGGEREFNFMWNRYKNETIPQEKIKLLYGMANTKDISVVQRLLEWSMDETKIRTQDFFSVLTFVKENPISEGYLWTWIKQNYGRIQSRFGTSHRYLGRILTYLVRHFNTESLLTEIKDFFARYPIAGPAKRDRARVLVEIRGNIAWMDKHEETISGWLEDNVS